jgi:hypothetical protein
VRCVAGQGILDENGLEVGVLGPERRYPVSGGVAFAVVLVAAVLAADGLWVQGDDLGVVGVDRPKTLRRL